MNGYAAVFDAVFGNRRAVKIAIGIFGRNVRHADGLKTIGNQTRLDKFLNDGGGTGCRKLPSGRIKRRADRNVVGMPCNDVAVSFLALVTEQRRYAFHHAFARGGNASLALFKKVDVGNVQNRAFGIGTKSDAFAQIQVFGVV